MYICFYNMFHIGDVYFMSLFLNIICKQNKNIDFFYYTINGDIFFKHITNLHRLSPNDNNYSSNLVNGQPPEQLLNKSIFNVLINFSSVSYKILKYNNDNILFVNTWCKALPLKYDEFDIDSAIKSFKDLILKINENFNYSLKFDINNPCDDILNNYNKINISIEYNKDIQDINNNTIFIFNYIPRSISYNMNILNNYISYLSMNNNVILASYNNIFQGNKNIKFIDKDYGIIPEPSCQNLLTIWNIAVKCKKIIILPSGGSWTFLHQLENIKKDQIYMFNNKHYEVVLNNYINTLTGEKKDIINSILI